MTLREHYEESGKKLLRAVQALEPNHVLSDILSNKHILTEIDYQAVVADVPSAKEWQGAPTKYGVSERYLFRFDALATLTFSLLGDNSHLASLASNVLRASENLRAEFLKRESKKTVAAPKTTLKRANLDSLLANLGLTEDDLLRRARWSGHDLLTDELKNREQELNQASLSIEEAHFLICTRCRANFQARVREQARNEMSQLFQSALNGTAFEERNVPDRLKDVQDYLPSEILANKSSVQKLVQELLGEVCPTR